MSAYMVGQRVRDRDHGDGEVYSLLHGRVWVKFDTGVEDRSYDVNLADTLLSYVTPPMFTEQTKPSLRALVGAMAKCRESWDCRGCVALAACGSTRWIPESSRMLLARALLEEASC